MWEGAGAGARAAAHVFVEDIAAPVLAGEDEHHLGRVLRLRPGEAVSVSDGRGGWRLCRFASGGGLEPAGPSAVVTRPEPVVAVGFAPTKGGRPEWAVEKLTEAGVDRILLLVADRSVVRWEEERATKQRARLAAVARGAAMQSRRLWLPTVEGPVPVGEAAGSGSGGGGRGVAGGAVALTDPDGAPPSLSSPCLLVGPEGGWSEREEALDLPRVALGPGILRTETAAVAAGLLLAALRQGLVGPAGP